MVEIKVKIDKVMSVLLDIPAEISLESVVGILARLRKLEKVSFLPNSLKDEGDKATKTGKRRGGQTKYPFLADRNLAVEFIAKFKNTAFKSQEREELCKPYGDVGSIEKHLAYVRKVLNISKSEIEQARAKLSK
jgi:hypothetical protein